MSSPASAPVILITGCSTGFGRSLALEALSHGMSVIATARRLDSIEDLGKKGAKVLVLDVTATREVLRNFATEAIGVFSQIDVLVNNAAYFLAGAVEEASEEQMRSQFDTNFFGVVNLTCAFLPHFRARKTGTIINISSQGAQLAISGSGLYAATKAAVDCISTVWSKELAPFNIRTMSVTLGTFRTAVAGSNTKHPANQIEGYDSAHEFLTIFNGGSGQERGDTDKAAKKLLDVISLKEGDGLPLRLPVRLALGEDAVGHVPRILREQLREAEEWREYGSGTDIDGVVIPDTGGRW
ncbi:short-chain dehydrogenase reductase sdr [Moniliophthora roreri MCA 2997]|uniref:Short-chain dehydrogenase reductase sdr n=1 Tax=Moniliophthora roreri (strain MCA 2997) TaxID=1381753 RepID=V2XLX3_MONRO|nr:short-chain dehydrogenase reductase sdr [Moniliophthora roreri MCA 2997]